MVGKIDPAPRVGEQVYTAIYTSIVNGEYPVGRRLQIRDLAHELGTSVMPVREALGRLEAVGLVETKPYRGAVVRALTQAELLDIYSVRRLLEVPAACRGTQHLARRAEQTAGHDAGAADPTAAQGADNATTPTGEAVAGLGVALTRMRAALAAGDVTGYLDADEEFLATIYRAANSPVLMEQIRSLWNRCRHYKIIGVEQQLSSGSSHELLDFQSRLLAAVDAGDAEQAAEITAESVDAASARIESGLYERSVRV